ncbi:MAG: hypothetical protein JWO47_574 [Candidatus Saccharibacteria bacterium]|nr:hypothetical protein [Candidatus Saccharibacteria bacterium]
MDKSTSQQITFIDKAFKNKDGHFAIWQMPNIPLFTWLIATILAKVVQNGKTHDLVTTAAFGALFAWALMEILTGVNYFRRILGLVVLVMLILSKVK